MPEGTAVARLSALPGVGIASGLAAQQGDPAGGRLLPVLPELQAVLPFGGLRRGSTVTVRDSTSLALALLAGATRAGSWAAVVGMPRLGVVAAGELGVDIRRLALVPRPGAEFATVVAALLDGVDMVLAAPPANQDARLARQLSARARNRGAVLLAAGHWPGAEADLHCRDGRWSGLEDGYGYLTHRQVTVHTSGRGAAAGRGRGAGLCLPGKSGAVTAEPARPPAELEAV